MMKKDYKSPEISEIRLDNNISLQLASEPPVSNPREKTGSISERSLNNSFSDDPYQYEVW